VTRFVGERTSAPVPESLTVGDDWHEAAMGYVGRRRPVLDDC
jgi:hypothetical protein